MEDNHGVLGFSNVARPVVGHGMFYIHLLYEGGNSTAMKDR